MVRPSAPPNGATRRKPDAEVSKKSLAVRSPFVDGQLHTQATRPKSRALTPERFQPCPYYDPREKPDRCGELVDRSPRRGVKPSQYCKRHAPLVLPLPRGSIGTLATNAKGRRYDP